MEGCGLSRTFLVLQNGTGSSSEGGGSEPAPAETLELGASERTFTADAAHDKELDVTANVAWTVKSSAAWLKVQNSAGTGSGTIVYHLAANLDAAARTATLTLGASERIFTADAANNKELKVTANVAWTAKSSAAWLVVKTASGSGNGTIVYNVAANTGAGSRNATLTVSGGGLTRTFSVKQSGKGSGAKSLQRKPRVWVTTSDGSDGAAVADGDEETAWTPATAEGSWVALSFEEARPVKTVDVLGENLPDGMRALVSEDGDAWSEEGIPAAAYLWLLLPPAPHPPTLREITTTP